MALTCSIPAIHPRFAKPPGRKARGLSFFAGSRGRAAFAGDSRPKALPVSLPDGGGKPLNYCRLHAPRRQSSSEPEPEREQPRNNQHDHYRRDEGAMALTWLETVPCSKIDIPLIFAAGDKDAISREFGEH